MNNPPPPLGNNIDDELPPLIPVEPPVVKRGTTLPTLIKFISQKNIEKVNEIINDPNNANILTRKTAKLKDKPDDIFNITALIAAVSSKDEAIVKVILDKMVEQGNQAMIKAVDTSGKTAADYATEYGLNNIVTLIIDASKGTLSSIPLTRNVTPLYALLESPTNTEQIKTIMEDATYMKSLSRTEFFKILIRCIQKYPENKDVYGKIIGDILDKVQKFETKLTNIGELWKANTSIISDSPDANKKYTLFMYVAMTPGADTKLMDIFLSRIPFAYITAKDSDGNTMLHHLAKTPGPEKLELLNYLKTKNKYAPSIVNNNNQLPVFLAAGSGNPDVALQLLDDTVNKENVNIQDTSGNTLLIEATKSRNVPFLEKLNAFDTLNQDIQNKEGKKASDYVVELGKLYTQPTARKTLSLTSIPKFSLETISTIDQIKYLFWNARDMSLCPVCLTLVDSEEGCIYLGHKCKDYTSIVHEELFNTLNENGNIGWCKTCGDLAFDHGHNEYNEIGQPKRPKKPWATNLTAQVYQRNEDLTDNACKSAGGLGYLQKYNRLYALYNEICKIMKEISQGKRITKIEGKKRAIAAMWNAAKPSIVNGVQTPNPDILPNAKDILDAIQADYNPVFEQHKFEYPNGKQSNKVNFNTDRDEKIKFVDSIFAQFNQNFICDLKEPQVATIEEGASSNVATNQPNVAEAARNEELLQNHKLLFTKLEEQIQSGHLPEFQRDVNEMDKPGPNGETEKVEAIPEDINHKCYIYGGTSGRLHNDGRMLYKFTHVQPGTNNHIEHSNEQSLYCAADLRSNLEDIFLNIPSDRFINPNEEPAVGVHCIFDSMCQGDIYPDQINAIPSHELYLPTEFEPELLSKEERTQKGDEFKKRFNDLFTRNRVMYDYDMWAQEDISMQKGGDGDGDVISSISDFIQVGEAEASCPLPPKQKAGSRIKTYRRKVGLRNVTRRV